MAMTRQTVARLTAFAVAAFAVGSLARIIALTVFGW
jgi:hypothetical protein